jgi:hypothetical protein
MRFLQVVEETLNGVSSNMVLCRHDRLTLMVETKAYLRLCKHVRTFDSCKRTYTAGAS